MVHVTHGQLQVWVCSFAKASLLRSLFDGSCRLQSIASVFLFQGFFVHSLINFLMDVITIVDDISTYS